VTVKVIVIVYLQEYIGKVSTLIAMHGLVKPSTLN